MSIFYHRETESTYPFPICLAKRVALFSNRFFSFRFPSKKVKFWNVLFTLSRTTLGGMMTTNDIISSVDCRVSIQDRNLDSYFNIEHKVGNILIRWKIICYFETDLLSKELASFQTNFTLNFHKEKKSTEVKKQEISAPASSHSPIIIEGVERLNVSASWKQFSRLGGLVRPLVPGDTVLTCQGETDTGVGAVDNILYVKGIRNCH